MTFLNDMRHIHHERKNQGNIWGGGAARQFTFKPPTLWGDFSIMAERPVPHQLPHHQQQFGFHPRTYSKCYEEKKPAHQEYSIQKNYVPEMKEK